MGKIKQDKIRHLHRTFTDKKTIILCVIISTGLASSGIIPAYSSSETIPEWIKDIAGFWSQGQITDSEFLGAIKFLIESDVLIIDDEDTDSKTNERNPASQKNPSNISQISDFIALGDSNQDKYNLRFSLMNSNLVLISEDGHVYLEILDKHQNELYSESFAVKKNDFKTYELKLTGNKFLAYAWDISTQDVMEGIGSLGTVRITFTDTNGNRFSAEDSIFIPEFSDEDLSTVSEKQFLETAEPINLSFEDDNLQIDLKQIGLFAHYDTWGNEVTDYRIDLTVKNIGNEPISFYTFETFILTIDGKQYESSFGGTFDSGKILVGSTVEGSVLFEVDDNIQEIKSIILDDYIFDLTNDRAYTEQQLREETYQKNSITISQTKTHGDFEITLNKVGSYETDGINGFRADITVKNIGDEPEYIPTDIVLLDGNGNQYDDSYHSTLKHEKIHPEVIKNGFVFFEDYSGDTSEITILITPSFSFEDYTWKWIVDLR